jgi:muramidase (phage lysozyme)
MDPKLKSFLDLIAFSEGTSTGQDDGYGVIVTGIHGPSTFTDYADHPFASGGSVTVRENPLLVSTAAGRYQLLARYWHVYRVQLDLHDYGHDSQDAVALQQIKERGAISLIESGDIAGAIKACSNIWASLPGNSYGQGGKSMAELVAKYQELAVNA